MKVTTAAAPSNPITPVTYTGFQFAPKQDYYQSFQGGVLAKLAVRTPWQFPLCSNIHRLPVRTQSGLLALLPRQSAGEASSRDILAIPALQCMPDWQLLQNSSTRAGPVPVIFKQAYDCRRLTMAYFECIGMTGEGGTLSELTLSPQVFAFDASRPSQNRSDGVLGMYKTASCRTTIELQLASPPPNVTVGSDQLYSDARPQAMGNVQHSKTTAIVVPCVIGGFVCAMILGCLTLGLAKKGPATLPK